MLSTFGDVLELIVCRNRYIKCPAKKRAGTKITENVRAV